MKRSVKICSILFLSLAIITMPEFLAGCASQRGATVRQAERLVAKHSAVTAKRAPTKSASAEAVEETPAEGPAWASRSSTVAPPAMGPGRERASRKHLLELYAGQQEIIEALERNPGSRKPEDAPGGGDDEEGRASALPPNISQDDLLRILGQQQKLIKALTNRNAKRGGPPTTGR